MLLAMGTARSSPHKFPFQAAFPRMPLSRTVWKSESNFSVHLEDNCQLLPLNSTPLMTMEVSRASMTQAEERLGLDSDESPPCITLFPTCVPCDRWFWGPGFREKPSPASATSGPCLSKADSGRGKLCGFGGFLTSEEKDWQYSKGNPQMTEMEHLHEITLRVCSFLKQRTDASYDLLQFESNKRQKAPI